MPKISARRIFGGVVTDFKNRAIWYKDDWTSGRKHKLRILAAGTYIFCASVVPALAFGQQFAYETSNLLTVVQVLAATACAGVIQAFIGGQPLLIIGVAEPIVLVYKYMYDYAADREDLGRSLFLPWASWACVWAALFIFILAATNACVYISHFTRFAGESFGALIAVLFLQQAVKGLVDEFRIKNIENPTWSLVNGLWSVFLALGLLLTSLLIRTARRWRFLNSPLRALFADYGSPLLVVAWSGLSYAVTGPSVPSRVVTPDTWDVKGTWTVSHRMGDVPSAYIAGALIPAAIIAILFFFDHNVSSQLAQQKEFGLQKPTAYHYDMMLLGCMTLMCGLLGLPPVNGVIPQSPMHTKACCLVVAHTKHDPGGKGKRKNNDTLEAVAAATEYDGDQALEQQGQHVALDIDTENRAGSTTTTSRCVGAHFEAHTEDRKEESVPVSAFATHIIDQVDVDGLDSSPPTNISSPCPSADIAVVISVAEQRWSGLMQALLVGACLAISPAIRCIPTAVLWGYFAFMALESLPGSQLWDRTLLLLTDPKRRHLILETKHAPYLETVPMRTIIWFTLLQLVVVGAIYALTWAGIAGVLFPAIVMLLVPLRQYILPRLFGNQALEELDRMEVETVEALSHEIAVAEAAAQGLAPRNSLDGEVMPSVSSQEILDEEMTRFQVIHRRTHAEIARRRTSSAAGAGAVGGGYGVDGNQG